MKIALTAPVYWPYIKRGGRLINGLARYLNGKGHEVTIITSKPGKSRRIIRDGITIVYHGEYSSRIIPKLYHYHVMSWPFFLSLLRERYDIVQSLFYIDAFSASWSKRFQPTKSVFYIPDGNIFPLNRRVDQWMLDRTIHTAEALVSPSRYIQETLKRKYGLEGSVIPPGVDTAYFQPVPAKDHKRPKILCMAELGMPRKRIPLLVKAFGQLKITVPEAILQLSGRIDRKMTEYLLELAGEKIRDSIQILGVGSEENIPRLYAEAAITVLPAVQEAFGMVLVESLSAGTPVVGTRDGGIPEIIDNPHVGVLFEGEGNNAVDALCTAMLQCLDLSRDPRTSDRCRSHGKRYDWSVIGPQLESLYRGLMNVP